VIFLTSGALGRPNRRPEAPPTATDIRSYETNGCSQGPGPGAKPSVEHLIVLDQGVRIVERKRCLPGLFPKTDVSQRRQRENLGRRHAVPLGKGGVVPPVHALEPKRPVVPVEGDHSGNRLALWKTLRISMASPRTRYGMRYGVPVITSSRVPDHLPGRPRWGVSASSSTTRMM
jgi:hypothetical protein